MFFSYVWFLIPILFERTFSYSSLLAVSLRNVAGGDYGIETLETSDGYLHLSKTNFGTNTNMLLSKYSKVGSHQWTSSYIIASEIIPFTMIETSDGNIVLCGEFYDGDYKTFVTKVNQINGSIIFSKSLIITSRLNRGYVVELKEGSNSKPTLVIASLMDFGGKDSTLLMEMDSDTGNLLWARRFGSLGNDEGQLQNFIICKNCSNGSDGFAITAKTSSLRLSLVIFNSTGGVVWANQYDPGVTTLFSRLYQTKNGDFVVGFQRVANYVVMRIAKNETFLWSKEISGFRYSSIYTENQPSVVEASNGDIIMAGTRDVTPDKQWLVRLSSRGYLIWSKEVYNGELFNIKKSKDGKRLLISGNIDYTSAEAFFMDMSDDYLGNLCIGMEDNGETLSDSPITVSSLSTKSEDVSLGSITLSDWFPTFKVDETFYGDIVAICNETCFGFQPNSSDVCNGRGFCDSLDHCSCFGDYGGDNCSVLISWNCFGINNEFQSSCSDHGSCIAENRCKCSNNYYGVECNITTCFGVFSNISSCSGNGTCKSYDSCVCFPEGNYIGVNCNESAFNCFGTVSTKHDSCGEYGSCTGTNLCHCDDLYYGEECNVTTCFGLFSNVSGVCNGEGICESFNNCTCKPQSNYYGSFCNSTFCFGEVSTSADSCSKNGDCIGYNLCRCNSDWFGIYCNITRCLGVFSNDTLNVCNKGNGICVSPDSCRCFSNFTGSTCNVTQCFGVWSNDSNVCSGNGKCLYTNNCTCNNAYYGTNCSGHSIGVTYGGSPDDSDPSKPGTNAGLIIGIVFGSIGGSGVLLFFCCISLIFLVVVMVICCIAMLVLCLLFFGGVCGVGYATSFFRGKKDSFSLGEDEFSRAKNEEMKKVAANVDIDKSIFEINYENLKVIKMIGSGGSQSDVFLCRWKNMNVAFKCFQTTDIMGNQGHFDDFEKEVKIMGSVRHPNCLTCYGSCLHPPRVGIVMEYCSNGDLKQFLEKNRDFSLEERIRILQEGAGAMEYLHDRRIIHRDLKSENILLTDTLQAKVMDFGLSKISRRVSQTKTKRVGTSYYMAPEVVLGTDYSEKCDLFSYGILMWEVLCGNFKPYDSLIFNVEFKVASDPKFRPNLKEIPEKLGKERRDLLIVLIEKSWDGNPEDRPSFKELRDSLEKLIIEE